MQNLGGGVYDLRHRGRRREVAGHRTRASWLHARLQLPAVRYRRPRLGACGRIETNVITVPPITQTVVNREPRDWFGWVAGVGAEAKLAGSSWIGRIEYLHYDFGTVEQTTSVTTNRPTRASPTAAAARQSTSFARGCPTSSESRRLTDMPILRLPALGNGAGAVAFFGGELAFRRDRVVAKIPPREHDGYRWRERNHAISH